MIHAMTFILILYFSFFDGDVYRRPFYGVYISQLIRFTRVCSHVQDFNARNKCLTAIPRTLSYSFELVGTGALLPVTWSTGAQLMIFFCFGFPMVLFGRPGWKTLYLLIPCLCLFIVLKCEM